MTQYLNIQESFHSHFDSKSETSTDGDDRDLHIEYLGNSRNFPTLPKGSSKAKSSLCKNFMQRGHCPYGGRCQFAHGPEELKINMDHNRSYKTKSCHAFEKKGYCCFGDRCNFIHERSGASGQMEPAKKWTAIYSNHR